MKEQLICDCNIIHKDKVERVLKNKPNEIELENLSKLFKILADATRIKILWILSKEEMCVCDISNVLNMTKSSISHQLAILRDNKIVKYKRKGKEVYYELDDNHIKKLYEIGLIHIEHLTKER